MHSTASHDSIQLNVFGALIFLVFWLNHRHWVRHFGSNFNVVWFVQFIPSPLPTLFAPHRCKLHFENNNKKTGYDGGNSNNNNKIVGWKCQVNYLPTHKTPDGTDEMTLARIFEKYSIGFALAFDVWKHYKCKACKFHVSNQGRSENETFVRQTGIHE